MKLYESTAECQGITSGIDKGRKALHHRRRLPFALAIATGLMASAGVYAQTTSVAGDGAMVLKNLTVPAGGTWIDGNIGGHYWQPDQVLGVCRVDSGPQGSNPPGVVSVCNTTAKAGGQILVAQPRNADGTPQTTVNNIPGAKYLFVPDASSKSTNVVRFVYDPRNETIGSPSTITVKNTTAVGGGSGGGRPNAAVLAPNGLDVYIGYLKSGDIMRVPNATTSSVGAPVKVGSTTDGRGVNALLLFKSDLYLAEIGGNGFSKIPDPSGVARAACNATAPCTATTVSSISSFPGGLATDGTSIYIGDAPLSTPGSVLRWNPATNQLDTYSVNVPAYTATPDGTTTKTYNQYVGPVGLGLAPNGDLYVADDPSFAATVATPPTIQGHLWKVAAAPGSFDVTSITPTSGDTIGGTVVTITGHGFDTFAGATLVNFGGAAGRNVSCSGVTTCAATSPGGTGTVDVRVIVAGAQTAASPADQFTYTVAPPPGTATGPSVTSVTPGSGFTGGGTTVTITGAGLTSTTTPPNATTINFGANAATNVSCNPNGTSCTALSPAGTGTVDVHVLVDGTTSQVVAGDKFSYGGTAASVYAFGITAPKGGMVFIPGGLGGHFWSSDHANGFCRQDQLPNSSLHALNYDVCDDGSIGSPGQAVYDPRPNADGTHYIYVPDNAVKSTAVWRLTFNPSTETLVGAPEGMIPLANVTTLKPNGMALGPDGNLYVTDLTELNIRKITGPNGDPRLQTVSIVAVTGDGRGANGTIGFIGNRLYISENRAASWIDITLCTGAGTPCQTNPITQLPGAAFVAGVATDDSPTRGHYVYAADSPGGAPATIYRYNADTQALTVYVPQNSGTVPNVGARYPCAVTCTRQVDTFSSGPGFSFAFGLSVDPSNGTLYVTEDATAGARSGRGRAFAVAFVP